MSIEDQLAPIPVPRAAAQIWIATYANAFANMYMSGGVEDMTAKKAIEIANAAQWQFLRAAMWQEAKDR